GYHIMGQPVPQVHQRGQQPVGESEPMLRTRADAAATRPRRQANCRTTAPNWEISREVRRW
ncbi:hypothetical protein ACIODS_32065, partial [Micromonospora chalcea]|uniref:hypothetical protein n=1 Tax=Micromonospora chalcea TaxID=1874 RepID=UPI003808B50C